MPGEGKAARRVANGSAICGPPVLPHAARQKAHRDSDDGKHRRHQDDSGEHLDQFQRGSSPRWRAPCAKYAPRYNATCIKAVWLAAWRRPARPRRSELPSVPGAPRPSQPSGSSHPSNRAKMPRPTSARASVHKATDTRSISLLPVGGVVASRPAPSDNRRNALLTESSFVIPQFIASEGRAIRRN